MSYDFSGWATKFNTECSDGLVIQADAFKHFDGRKVTLAWEHDNSTPSNICGNATLEWRPEGMYAYGTLNDTQAGQDAKELIKHGDITNLSIHAKRVKRRGNDVIHGDIHEVSLVVVGANPGAIIEFAHSNTGTMDCYIFQDENEIVANPVIHADGEGDDAGDSGDLDAVTTFLETLNNDQAEKVNVLSELARETEPDAELIGTAAEALADSLDELQRKQFAEVTGVDLTPLIGETRTVGISEAVEHSTSSTVKATTNTKGGSTMKRNAFSGSSTKDISDNIKTRDTLQHSLVEHVKIAKATGGSFKHAYDQWLASAADLLHTDTSDVELMHTVAFPQDPDGGNGYVGYLFPEPVEKYNPPHQIRNVDTGTDVIMNGINKTPFSRVKTTFIDMTDEQLRAKGYIKGEKKTDGEYKMMKRVTTPTTVYIKRSIDNDDYIDIESFDAISWLDANMGWQLQEDLARAILIGDGRDIQDANKINEENIRPIATDDDMYTIKLTTPTILTLEEDFLLALGDFRGGPGTLFISRIVSTRLLLRRNAIGERIFKSIADVAAALNVPRIVISTFLEDNKLIYVDLSKYDYGASRKGRVQAFRDFDIDFNLHKLLKETRGSGALVQPKSAIAITITDISAITANIYNIPSGPAVLQGPSNEDIEAMVKKALAESLVAQAQTTPAAQAPTTPAAQAPTAAAVNASKATTYNAK